MLQFEDTYTANMFKIFNPLIHFNFENFATGLEPRTT